MATETAAEEVRDLQYASEGTGPLLQRDYWAAFRGVDRSPEQVIEAVRSRFCDFAPPETAAFRLCGEDCDGPLDLGSEMEIHIRPLALCRVRVVHRDERSLTLRTLAGHPEAGRITFGSYRDDAGTLAFRIRSRTRQAGLLHYLGFLLIGKQMQSRCWIKFIGRLAEILGGQVEDTIHVRTRTTRDRPADWGAADEPTFPTPEVVPDGRS